ncbi:MAG: FAD:protein FMN transferase [Vicingaceae bacterium]
MKNIIFFAFLSCVLFSCQPNKSDSNELVNQEYILQGEAQGTTYTIKYLGDSSLSLKHQVDSLLSAFDKSLSTYLPSSLISQFNQSDSMVIDEIFKQVFLLSKEINEITSGAFDPSIGPLIKAWGFDYSKPEKMDSTKVDSLLAICGFDLFSLKDSVLSKKVKGARLNFNANAQGYSVDLICKLLDEKKVENYYVELGGELKVKGKNKRGEWWLIGIDRPEGKNLERNLGARISLENQAMATSGNYRKYYEIDGNRYSHTLNPKTGYPAKNKLMSATVIANDCGTADAYATAFMVMGVDKTKSFLKNHPELSAYLIYSGEEENFETYFTPHLAKSIEEF